MHIQTKMMGHTTGEPTAMLLSFRRKLILDIDWKNAPIMQTLGDHTHARMMMLEYAAPARRLRSLPAENRWLIQLDR